MHLAVSKYKIRYFYPVIISLIVILVSIFTIVWSVFAEENEIIHNEKKHLELSGIALQNSVNSIIKNRDFKQLPQVFSYIASQPNYIISFIESPQGTLFFSPEQEFTGISIDTALNKIGVSLDRSYKNGFVVMKNRIIYSIPLGFGKATGKLWIIHDITEEKYEHLKTELEAIVGFGIVLLGAFFMVSFLLYRSAIKRLNNIRTNFLKFGLGQRGLTFKVPGNDEISEIGEALHEMSLLVERDEALLIQKEKILKEMVGNLQGIAYKCLDFEGKEISFISKGCVFLTGYTDDDFMKTRSVSFERLIDHDDYAKTIELIKIQLMNTKKYEVEYRIRQKTGGYRWVMDKGTGILKSSNLISREGLIVDITNSKEVELKIRERDKIINQYVEIIDSYVITSKTDEHGEIIYVSDAFAKLTGYTREELIGKKHNLLRHPEMSNEFYEEMWKILKTGMVWRGEIKNKKKNGDYYWVDVCITPTTNDTGQITGFTAVSEDISDRKKIEEIAITDDLTGLFNRRFFNITMPRELNRAIREKRKFVFVMADVDYFKKYNDNYGHQKGDKVLTEIGRVIKSTFKRSGDFGFRLGGEEFGVFWHADDYEGVVRVISIFRSAVEQLEIEHKYSEITDGITISIGVCLCQDNYKQEEVYKNADEALYEAKNSGRNQIKYRNI